MVVDMGVHELSHRHHRMGSALQESRIFPANNFHFADKVRAHLRDRRLMWPIGERLRLERLAENGHYVPLEDASPSGRVRPIHQAPEMCLETWVCRVEVVFHRLENEGLVDNGDSIVVRGLLHSAKCTLHQGRINAVELEREFAPKTSPIKVEAENVKDGVHTLVTARVVVLPVKAVELATEIAFDCPVLPANELVFRVVDGGLPGANLAVL